MSRTRIVKGKITEVIGKDYSIFSESNIVDIATELITEKGETNGISFQNPSKPAAGEIKAKCLVHFRPHNKWNGEYGFDWIRTGDTGQSGDKKWYRDIMGNYTYPKTKYGFDYCNPNFHNLTSEYDKLVTSEFRKMIVTWKKNGKYPYYYIIPYLSLLPNNKAILQLKIETEEQPESFELEYDTNYFTAKLLKPIPTSTGKHTIDQCLEITCTNEFVTDQEIIIKAFKDGIGEDVGKLIVVKNSTSNQRKIKVTLVQVFKGRNSVIIADETSFLKKIFKQSYVNLKVQKTRISIPSTVNVVDKFNQNVDEMFQYLNTELKNSHNSNGVKNGTFYDDSYKIFYVTDVCETNDCGGGYILGYSHELPKSPVKSNSIKSSVIVFNLALTQKKITMNKSAASCTASHELLHAIGLSHTFDDYSKYVFKQCETDNIMDYNDDVTNLVGKQTYKWQWDLIKKQI